MGKPYPAELSVNNCALLLPAGKSKKKRARTSACGAMARCNALLEKIWSMNEDPMVAEAMEMLEEEKFSEAIPLLEALIERGFERCKLRLG